MKRPHEKDCLSPIRPTACRRGHSSPERSVRRGELPFQLRSKIVPLCSESQITGLERRVMDLFAQADRVRCGTAKVNGPFVTRPFSPARIACQEYDPP